MKILFALTILIMASLLGSSYSINFVSAQFSQQNKLSVSFENNVAPSYEVILNPNEKYILAQSHSLIRDETSRHNLVSYSLDDSDPIQISRLARGDFTLDIPTESSHSIVFKAVTQFPIAVEGADVFFFTPESPTRDNWFDTDSNVSIVIPKVTEIEEDQIRRIISGWAIDKTELKVVLEDDSEFFNTPTIQMSNFHTVDITTKTQYKLDVLSEFGTPVGSGWYNAGSEVSVSVISPNEGLIRHIIDRWEGPNIEVTGKSAQLTITGPSVVRAFWTTDYSLLVVSIIIPIGIVVAFIVKRKKKAPTSAELISENKVFKKFDAEYYEIEIIAYVKQKTLEKLGSMRDSDLITESKYSEMKEMVLIFKL